MGNLRSSRSPARIRGRSYVHTLHRTFVVDLVHGLHARPSALLVKTLRGFHSESQVAANGETANGHSLMGLLTLAAGHGCNITFTITGEDAPQAMAAVAHLFETHFSEAYHNPPALVSASA